MFKLMGKKIKQFYAKKKSLIDTVNSDIFVKLCGIS